MKTSHPFPEEEIWYPLVWSTLERGAGSLRVPAPLLRLSACGLLRVEMLTQVRETPVLEGRYSRLTEEQVRGRNGAQALTLLKLLISREHRHAPKHYLMEHLGHGERAITERRLDDLITSLRGLLSQEQWEQVRTHLVQYFYASAASGTGYRLAPYPLIWLDTDALAWNIEHATRLERFGEGELACPYWERAYTLASRGDYLSDEEYADWAEGKQGEVARGRRNSLHALSRLLLAHAGEAGEAQLLHLLSAYCAQYPTDEDMLRPLMELLGKHERFGEALSFYEQTSRLLLEEGLSPQRQTSEIAQVLRTKELHRQPRDKPASRRSLPAAQSLHAQDTSLLGNYSRDQGGFQSDSSPSHEILFQGNVTPWENLSAQSNDQLLQIMAPTILNGATWFGLKHTQMSMLLCQWMGHLASSCFQLQLVLHQEISHFSLAQSSCSTQPEYQLARQQLLLTLAGSPLPLLSQFQEGSRSPLLLEEFFAKCTAGITACWYLTKGNDLLVIEQFLSLYVPPLAQIANDGAPYQQVAAGLLVQVYLIRALMALHRQDLSTRELHSRNAVFYSRQTTERNLQAAAYLFHGYSHYYLHMPEHALELFGRALERFPDISPLMRSNLFLGMAASCAQCGKEQEAKSALASAHLSFPPSPEYDPGFLYADCSLSTLYLWEGRTFLDLGTHTSNEAYYQQASTILKQIESVPVMNSERNRTGMLLCQARAAIGLGDLEQGCVRLGTGIALVEQLGSRHRFAEANAVLQRIAERWPHERQSQQLVQRFEHSPFNKQRFSSEEERKRRTK